MNENEQIKDLKEELSKLTTTINELRDALTGNKLTKEKGLIDRIIDLETFVEYFNTKKSYFLGYASAIVFSIGAILALGKLFIWIFNGIQNLKL